MTLDLPTLTDQRRRGVRRTALLLGFIAAVFYVGFMAMMIWRGGNSPIRNKAVTIMSATPTGIAAARQAIEMSSDISDTIDSFST